MHKPSDAHQKAKNEPNPDETGVEAKPAPGVKAWPFAPGSQLDKQVARPWTPKPFYRFNQR